MLDEGIPIRDGKIVRADPETTRIGLPPTFPWLQPEITPNTPIDP